MTELFGFQAGQRLAAKDRLEEQLAELELQKGAQQLRAGEVAIQKSQLDVKNAEITADRQATFLQLLKEAETGNGTAKEASKDSPGEGDLPSRLDMMADLSLKSGLPEEAAEYASKASTIRNNSSLIQQREEQQKLKELTFAAGILQGVQDQRSFNEANLLYEAEFGRESPFKGMQYSSELVERIKGSVTTERQRSLIREAEARAKAASTELKERESRIALNEARTRLTETRERNLTKAGGAATKVTGEDLRAVTDLITADYGAGGRTLPEDIRILARPIAERAVQLAKEQNLSRSEASAKAYKEAVAAGRLGGMKPRDKAPGSLGKPLAVPEDKAKLLPNKYYFINSPKFTGTALWTGKTFQAVQLPEEEDDEEADTELEKELDEEEEE